MLTGKGEQPLVPIGHLRANGVVHHKGSAPLPQQPADSRILGRALGGLGENGHGLSEIQLGQCLQQHGFVLYHQGVSAYLPQQAQYLCMPHAAKDNHLPMHAFCVQRGIGFADAFLQLQHHRAGAVDDFQLAPGRLLIRAGRFPVRPDEHRASLGHFRQTLNRNKPALLQAGQFCLVMDNIAQRIHARMGAQVFLGPGDGPDNAPAEAGTGVYLYAYHDRPGLSSRPNFPCSRPSIHTSSSCRVMCVLSST